MLLFSENDQNWQPAPSWVEFLIKFGYRWHRNNLQQRRIALISMPCDSAAAGLISLGALIRDLESPNSNDIDGHYNALLRYAQQYLKNCRFCTSCQPDEMKCDYTKRATGWIRDWHCNPSKRYIISEQTDLIKRRLLLSYKGGIIEKIPKYATDWQIDNEPPPQLSTGQGILDGKLYAGIIDDIRLNQNNLKMSYSGLCFAGRVGGESLSREICASIKFCFDDSKYNLSDLLTVNGWSSTVSVSRMSFFNSRTEHFDRYSSEVSLVIADNDKALLKIFGQSQFQRSDLIGVIHRTIDHTDLEAVGERINALRQWYTDDSEMLADLPPIPRGINIMMLKRRKA
jgi:hypothetical protein